MSDSLDFLTNVADEDRQGVDYRLQALVLDIGERVHARLQQMGITQAELARRMGVSRPMVTKLLTGESNFQLRTLLRLSEALDMELVVGFMPEGFRLPQFYISRGVEPLGSYRASESQDRVTATSHTSGHKEVVRTGQKRSASEYTVPTLLKVAHE